MLLCEACVSHVRVCSVYTVSPVCTHSTWVEVRSGIGLVQLTTTRLSSTNYYTEYLGGGTLVDHVGQRLAMRKRQRRGREGDNSVWVC